MSSYFPHDSFRPTNNIRVRGVPEWGCVLIYTPANPKVHYLDARSWLIFDLCDGRSYDALLAEFSEAVPEGTPADQIRSALDKGLDALASSGIVERTPAADQAPIQAGAG